MKVLVLHNDNLPSHLIDFDEESINSEWLKDEISIEGVSLKLPDTDIPEYDTFICSKLKNYDFSNYDVIVLPYNLTDNQVEYTSLRVVAHIRLTREWGGLEIPILFLGAERLEDVLIYSDYGDILSSYNIYKSSETSLDCIKNLLLKINGDNHQISHNVADITSSSQYDYFLKCLTRIQPPANYSSNHSIANAWGAKALSKILPSSMVDLVSNKLSIILNEDSLYYKYRIALSSNEKYEYHNLEAPIDIGDKKVLIIDDEADKGWSVVLEALLKATFKPVIFNKKAAEYNHLPQNIRDGIKKGVYDLVFLDLRMKGEEEENIYNPRHFSGMKILKEIKKNKGVQVIMLTASNKAWNLKALLQAGADGYYIKESPEYGFSKRFSEANSKELCNTINRCIERNYLKDIYTSIGDIEEKFKRNQKAKKEKDYQEFLNGIKNQIKLAFELENLTDPTEDVEEEQRKFAFAYIALYQVIEIINKKLVVQDANGRWRLGDKNGQYATGMQKDLSCHYSLAGKDSSWKYPEWMKIMSLFHDYWKQQDDKFIKTIYNLIDKRNSFLHDDKQKLTTIHADVYSPKAFKELFKCIEKLCNFL